MRIVTWNTWWCFGPWEERQPLLATALSRRQPDVVLLQETWPAQTEALADACGLEVVSFAGAPFDPPVLDTVDADHPFGNAILAPAGQARLLAEITLDSPGDAAPRRGLAAEVTADGHACVVVSTHLNHLHDHGTVRAHQLETLRSWLADLAPDRAVILGGDLNQTPSSDEYQQAVVGRWTDLWSTARPTEHGFTMVAENPHITSAAWMADRNPPGTPAGVRLDYLLTRADPAPRPELRVETIEALGGATDGWPSDHLGLVADLTLHA